MNTVDMGLTLFGLELDGIRDAVEQMVVGQDMGGMGGMGLGMGGMEEGMGGMGQGMGGMGGMEEGQSGAQQASLEVMQKFLLGKVPI
jgi:hypothetical protein